jgi:hypothetical protein
VKFAVKHVFLGQRSVAFSMVENPAFERSSLQHADGSNLDMPTSQMREVSTVEICFHHFYCAGTFK